MTNDIEMLKTTNSHHSVEQNPAVGVSNYKPDSEHWVRSQAIFMCSTIDIAKTVQAFWQSRLYVNMNAFKALVSCRDPVELAGSQREYVENTTAQYHGFAQDISGRIQQCIDGITHKNSAVKKS